MAAFDLSAEADCAVGAEGFAAGGDIKGFCDIVVEEELIFCARIHHRLDGVGADVEGDVEKIFPHGKGDAAGSRAWLVGRPRREGDAAGGVVEGDEFEAANDRCAEEINLHAAHGHTADAVKSFRAAEDGDEGFQLHIAELEAIKAGEPCFFLAANAGDAEGLLGGRIDLCAGGERAAGFDDAELRAGVGDHGDGGGVVEPHFYSGQTAHAAHHREGDGGAGQVGGEDIQREALPVAVQVQADPLGSHRACL